MPFARNLVASSAIAFAAAYANADDPGSPTLTKGHGIPVCDAYLERLTLIHSDRDLYCGRPENDEIKGFARLNRIALDADKAFAFADKVKNFTQRGNQDALLRTRSSFVKSVFPRDLGRSIFVWRYDPPVDIDNDGTPDSLLLWQGYGASHGNYVCGFVKTDYPVWQSQMAYVVDFEAQRINEKRTREIFGHPTGHNSKFRPIGRKISIFEYGGLYYFDTFFDSSGDFEGNRQTDPQIATTLGVFLRKDDVTKQVCEYRWTKARSVSK